MPPKLLAPKEFKTMMPLRWSSAVGRLHWEASLWFLDSSFSSLLGWLTKIVIIGKSQASKIEKFWLVFKFMFVLLVKALLSRSKYPFPQLIANDAYLFIKPRLKWPLLGNFLERTHVLKTILTWQLFSRSSWPSSLTRPVLVLCYLWVLQKWFESSW